MWSTITKAFGSLVVVQCLSISVKAAPLDLGHVAADAKWIMHIDLDAVRDTRIYQKMKENPRHLAFSAMMQGMLGINPDQDLHSVTMYGTTLGKEKGVAIVEGKIDSKRLAGMLKTCCSPEFTESKGLQIMELTHTPPHREQPMHLAMTIVDDQRLVAAHSVEALHNALAVLQGEGKCLTSSDSLAGNIPTGTTVLMRVEGIAAVAAEKEFCPLAKQTESFRFVMGESNGSSFYRARAVMSNDQVTKQLKEVVEGAIALGKLHVGKNEVGKRLIEATHLKTDDSTLTLLWNGSADDVLTMIEAHRKFFAEHRAKHRSRWQHGKKPGAKSDKAKPTLEEDF